MSSLYSADDANDLARRAATKVGFKQMTHAQLQTYCRVYDLCPAPAPAAAPVACGEGTVLRDAAGERACVVECKSGYRWYPDLRMCLRE